MREKKSYFVARIYRSKTIPTSINLSKAPPPPSIIALFKKKRKTRDYSNANLTDANYSETTTIYTTYLYENKKKFFVLDGETDYFREILGKGPSRSPMHRNSLVDLMVNFIRRG